MSDYISSNALDRRICVHDGWLEGVEKKASPNFSARPMDESVSLLVVHNISLPPGEFGGGYIEDFFLNELDIHAHDYFQTIATLKVSAHCLISRNGMVTQFVSFNDRAWHAGRSSYEGKQECNDYSIGIELEGTDDIAYTGAQYEALAVVTRSLMAQYPLLTRGRITGHSDISPGRKTDPGESFDWRFYRELLNL